MRDAHRPSSDRGFCAGMTVQTADGDRAARAYVERGAHARQTPAPIRTGGSHHAPAEHRRPRRRLERGALPPRRPRVGRARRLRLRAGGIGRAEHPRPEPGRQRRLPACRPRHRPCRLPRPRRRAGPRSGARQHDRDRLGVRGRGSRRRRPPGAHPLCAGRAFAAGRPQREPGVARRALGAGHLQAARQDRDGEGPRAALAGRHRRRAAGAPGPAHRAVRRRQLEQGPVGELSRRTSTARSSFRSR